MLYGKTKHKNEEYRKYYSFPQIPTGQNANPKLPPAKGEGRSTSRVDDYYLKEWIPREFSHAGRRPAMAEMN
jgi:hypothetical protein